MRHALLATFTLCAAPLGAAQEPALEPVAPAPRLEPASALIGKDLHSRPDAEGKRKDLGDLKDFVVDSGTGQVTHVIVSSGGIGGLGDSLRRLPFSDLSVVRERPADGKGEGKLVASVDLDEEGFDRLSTITADALEPYRCEAIAASQKDLGRRAREANSDAATQKAREAHARANALMLLSELDDLAVRACAASHDKEGKSVAGEKLGEIEEAWIDVGDGKVMYVTLELDGRELPMPMDTLAVHVDTDAKALYVPTPCPSGKLAEAPALAPDEGRALASEAFRAEVARFYAAHGAEAVKPPAEAPKRRDGGDVR